MLSQLVAQAGEIAGLNPVLFWLILILVVLGIIYLIRRL